MVRKLLNEKEIDKLVKDFINLQKINKRNELRLREANREIERLKNTVQSLTKGK